MQIAREILYLKRDALGIAAVYALFGLLWLLASDEIMSFLRPLFFNTRVEKDVVYILITACFVYALIWTHVSRLQRLQQLLADQAAVNKQAILTAFPKGRFRQQTFGIAAIYALFGLLWILASERLLPVLPPSAFLTFFVTYREALYIIITACLLCLLLRTHLLKIRKLESSLFDTTTRANHLEQAKKIAEASNLAKTELLARISHDIRTPLTSIIGMSDLIMETQLNAKQRDYMRRLGLAAEHLLELISDSLTLSNLEAGKERTPETWFKVRDVVAEVRDILELNAKENGVLLKNSVAQNIPESLYGDAPALREILINLVANALEYTSTGEVKIKVECDSRKTDTAALLFMVSDTGIGIEPEALDGIFEPFSQGQDSQGSGLGLAICKQLVARMGGRIWVESQVGTGSTFTFSVKFRESNPAAEPNFANKSNKDS